MMRYIVSLIILCSCLSMTAQAQQRVPYRPNPNTELARMFYAVPYYRLQHGILETARLHAIYSYILANLSTPDFDFYQYLPPEDRQRINELVPDRKTFEHQIAHEFVMSRFNENSKRYTAYVTMWKGKKDSLNTIVTLGK